MISVTQLRNGVTFLHRSQPYKVIDYKHKHMGRGGGTIKVKIKNLKTGAVLLESFKSGDRVEDIQVVKKQMQFLYKDGDEVVLMNQDTYEQVNINAKILGKRVDFLAEEMNVWVHIWETEPPQVIDIDLPAKVTVRLKFAAPGEKGNSASNIYKDGILENGAKVRIPLFVNSDDKIVISTVDGSYVERA
ncbi:MAG: elongation factor P [Patescibacteria group bacterium]